MYEILQLDAAVRRWPSQLLKLASRPASNQWSGISINGDCWLLVGRWKIAMRRRLCTRRQLLYCICHSVTRHARNTQIYRQRHVWTPTRLQNA